MEIRIEETGAQIDVSNLPTIDGDPLQLRQLLQNLIGNSLKYRREEFPPEVSVSGCVMADSANGAPQSCKIEFKDNGIGFDKEYAERIFGIFQRLHGRNQYEGTGVDWQFAEKLSNDMVARSAHQPS